MLIADTTIVKVALSASEKREDQVITVASDDTDVFCLLIHHCYHSNSEVYENIYLMNMKKGKKSLRSMVRIGDVINQNYDATQKYILFAHCFTGCDTTRAIFNYMARLNF